MQSAYFEQVIIPKSTSYAKWSLGLSITETASTSTDITISISVYMIRDSTPGDKKATGYHFDNGNSLAISVGGSRFIMIQMLHIYKSTVVWHQKH